MEGQDKLRGFYDRLKGNPGILGLPDNYDVFKNSLLDADKAEGFFKRLKDGGRVSGLPDSFAGFSKILPDRSAPGSGVFTKDTAADNVGLEKSHAKQGGFWNDQVGSVLRKAGVEDVSFPTPVVSGEDERKNRGREKGFWNTYGGDTLEKLGAGTVNLQGNMYSAADKAYNFVLRPWVNLFRDDDGSDSWLKNQAGNSYAYSDELRKRSDRYNGENFIELWKNGDYTGAVGDIFLQASENLPRSLAVMLSGGAGLAVSGVSAAVNKYDELDEMPESKDLPECQKIINAISTGMFEALFDKLATKSMESVLKSVYSKNGKEAGEKIVKEGFRGFLRDSYKKYGVLLEPVAEGIEETATQIAENATDYVTGVSKKFNLMDGSLESFVYGVAGKAQSLGGAAVPPLVKRKVEGRKANSGYRKSKEALSIAFPDYDINVFEERMSGMLPDGQMETLDKMLRSPDLTNDQKLAVLDFTGKANQHRAYNNPETRIKDRVYVQLGGKVNEKNDNVITIRDVNGNPFFVRDQTSDGRFVRQNDGSWKFIPKSESGIESQAILDDYIRINLEQLRAANKNSLSHSEDGGDVIDNSENIGVQRIETDWPAIAEVGDATDGGRKEKVSVSALRPASPAAGQTGALPGRGKRTQESRRKIKEKLREMRREQRRRF